MKTYICLATLTVLIVGFGCAPRLAETPLGSEETRWEGYIKKSYPAWKSPQTVPPAAASKGNIQSPAGLDANDSKASNCEALLIEDAIVTDNKGQVVAETVSVTEINKNVKTYIVEKNDTLWKISKKVYQDGSKWKTIKAANSDVLKGSNTVHPGMSLKIPSN